MIRIALLNVAFLFLLFGLMHCKYRERRNHDSREDRRLRLVTLYDSDRDFSPSVSSEYEEKPRRASNHRSKKTNRLGSPAVSLSSEAEVLVIDPRKLLTKMAKDDEISLHRALDRYSSTSRSSLPKQIEEERGKLRQKCGRKCPFVFVSEDDDEDYDQTSSEDEEYSSREKSKGTRETDLSASQEQACFTCV